jgi:hypothetical protein
MADTTANLNLQCGGTFEFRQYTGIIKYGGYAVFFNLQDGRKFKSRIWRLRGTSEF